MFWEMRTKPTETKYIQINGQTNALEMRQKKDAPLESECVDINSRVLSKYYKRDYFLILFTALVDMHDTHMSLEMCTV